MMIAMANSLTIQLFRLISFVILKSVAPFRLNGRTTRRPRKTLPMKDFISVRRVLFIGTESHVEDVERFRLRRDDTKKIEYREIELVHFTGSSNEHILYMFLIIQ